MRIVRLIFSAILLVLTTNTKTVSAICTQKVNFYASCDGSCGVPLNFGSLTLSPSAFLPPGSLMGRVIVSPLQARGLAGVSPDTELFECDISDRGQIYELYATGATSNSSGALSSVEYPDTYQTNFPYVGLKLINVATGKAFTNKWQKRPMTNLSMGSDNKIHIYARDFSDVQAEVYRFKSTIAGPGLRGMCNNPEKDNYKGAYLCRHANGYEVFVGPGINDREPSLRPGASAKNTDGMNFKGSIGFGMTYQSLNMLSGSMRGCKVSDYTHVVPLPDITQQELMKNVDKSQTFFISYLCSGTGIYTYVKNYSGVGEGQIAIAFVAKNTANNYAGVTANSMPYLLSDNYGMPGYAEGVGVKVYTDQGDAPGQIRFLKQYISRNTEGWYPILKGVANFNGSDSEDELRFTALFNATLAALPGEKIVPGRVVAYADIVVRYQ